MMSGVNMVAKPASDAAATPDSLPAAAASVTAGIDAVLASKPNGIEAQRPTPESVAAELAAMGFSDVSLVKTVIAKQGPDLEACIQELVNLSGWDAMLSDLEEMGFSNRELNTKLLEENNGSLKRQSSLLWTTTEQGNARRLIDAPHTAKR